eukprot:2023078-Pyramimonas_sp.AAC.1
MSRRRILPLCRAAAVMGLSCGARRDNRGPEAVPPRRELHAAMALRHIEPVLQAEVEPEALPEQLPHTQQIIVHVGDEEARCCRDALLF